MHHHQKQSPVGKTGLSGYEAVGTEIVASAEKTGNTANQEPQLVAVLNSREGFDALKEFADRKRLANLCAQFALRGFSVHAVSDGFLVTRWNLTKHARDLDALEAFGRVVGAV